MSQLIIGLVQSAARRIGILILGQAWQAAEELGADRHKYFSAGGSAGGGLAFSVAENIIANGNQDHIQGIVSLVPVTLHYSNIPDEFRSMYNSYDENAVGVPIIDKYTMSTFFGRCLVNAESSG